MKSPEHPHIIITGLVYPAFLGAFLYKAALRFFALIDGRYSLSLESSLLLFFLIIVFVGDYVYTADKERRKIYSWGRLGIDFLMVGLLYLSLSYTLEPKVQDFSIIWIYLALFKFLSACWDWFGKDDEQSSFATFISFSFSVLYVMGWLLFKSVTWALIIVLLVDSMIYLNWERFCNDK